MHVAPQRFSRVAGSGPCGLAVGVKGSPGKEVRIAAVEDPVDPWTASRVHIATPKIPANGLAEVAI